MKTNYDNKIFYAETCHSKPFKDIIEILNGVVHEVTMVVKKKKEKKDDEEDEEFYGLEIATSNDSKSIFIKLQFKGKQFNKFYTKYDKEEIGINLEHLNIHIKPIEPSSILSLYINEKDRQTIRIEGSNEKEESLTVSNFKRMELEYKEKKPRVIPFDVSITMKSSLFNKICKEMNNISDYVEIKCLKNKFIFSCKGDCGTKEKIYTEKEGGISIDWDDNIKCKITQGIYELKNIILFNKCAPLSNQILILMKNDDILSIKYVVADLADLVIALSPVDEKKISQDYDFSDDEDDILMKSD